MTVIEFPSRDTHSTSNSNFEDFPHQVEELDFLRTTPRAFLLSEAGTGKTMSLLEYAATVLVEQRQNVLWVTESGLIDQLDGEVRRWLGPRVPRPTRLERGDEVGPFVVTSHAWLARNRNWLADKSFELVVVDEAHAVRAGGLDPDAAVFRAVHEVVGRSRRSVMATATPISTRHGLDLYALLAAGHAPGLMPSWRFLTLVRWVEYFTGHGYAQPRPWDLRHHGRKHLAQVLARCAIATGREHVPTIFPHVSRYPRSVRLTPDQRAEYRKLRHGESGLPHWRSLTKASPTVDAMAAEVVDSVRRHLTGTTRHIVVFAERHVLLEEIAVRLTAAHIPHWKVTGRESPSARSQAVEDHRRSPAGVLLGTRTIDTGLNLQHCSVLISAVSTWDPVRSARREGTMCRVGSPFQSVTHVILTTDTGDVWDKCRSIGRKSDLYLSVMEDVPCPWTWMR